MPLIPESGYRPNLIYRRAHLSTILPTLLRRPPSLDLTRERIELADGDFLDIDRCGPRAGRTALLCHGLEGNSRRNYMLGMCDALRAAGWSCVLMNFRSCSGEPNRRVRSYHAGATDDLRAVIDHIELDQPPEIALVGFSMGGNLILKYLGEDPAAVHPRLRAAVAFSVPVNLGSSCREISRPHNRVYSRRFLRKLARKIRRKALDHPGRVDASQLRGVKDLWEFDERFTAPLHGFANATDYYEKCSALRYLSAIARPTLLVNAANDPFLDPECYPVAVAESSVWLTLEIPKWGGHTGFRAPGRYWSEQRAVEFIAATPPLA